MQRSWIAEQAVTIAVLLKEGGFEPTDSVLHLASEAGEFAGAWTRYKGRARRTGPADDARIELADVVIAAYVVAEQHSWDLDYAITRNVIPDPYIDDAHLVLGVNARVGGFITMLTSPLEAGRKHASAALAQVVLAARKVAAEEGWDLNDDIARKVDIGFERGFGERGNPGE